MVWKRKAFDAFPNVMFMKKRILLIGYNYYPEPTGIGKYNGEMMEWFVKQGYDCTILTSYPYYPYWKVQEPYYKNRFWYTVEKSTDPQSGGKLKIIRCPQYVPSKPSGLKRMLLDLSFLISATFPLIGLIFQKKIDYVISVAPSFQLGLLGVIYKKLKGSKLIYHIQDMQIEAARDLNMIKSKALINILFKMEKFIFSQSEVVSSISDGMVNKIQEKAKKDVSLFPNWTDTALFYPMPDKDALKSEFGYRPTDKIVVYSGSIGEKQGLEAILHAANKLRELNYIKFIICGSGPYKIELQKLADNLQLVNVNFLPLQPFEKFNHFLNVADLHLIIQKSGASDLVMPSKLTTILSVGGLSLITANKGSGLYSLAEQHKIGLLVEAENQTALNEGILQAVRADFSQVNKNARAYAERHLSIDNVMRNFEQFITNQTKMSDQNRLEIKEEPVSTSSLG
jgi:colanic acid biosynthesis glycosyl transferase WcaI